MKRLLVLCNPKASRGQTPLADALDRVRRRGIQIRSLTPAGPEQMRALILAESQECDAVVVGGGDGTINSALTAVLQAGLPLGVLPLGTANDLARTLGIPADVDAACDLLVAGTTRAIDVAWANDRPFLNAAGIGLGSRIAREISPSSKRLLGPLSYASAVIEGFRRHRAFRAEIRSEQESRTVASIQITVGNGVYYGGGTPLPDGSAIDDGRLDLFSINPQPLRRLIGVALAIRRGTHAELDAGLDMATGAEFEVVTRPAMTVSVDGEPLSRTPVRFRVDPGALHVIAP